MFRGYVSGYVSGVCFGYVSGVCFAGYVSGYVSQVCNPCALLKPGPAQNEQTLLCVRCRSSRWSETIRMLTRCGKYLGAYSIRMGFVGSLYEVTKWGIYFLYPQKDTRYIHSPILNRNLVYTHQKQ